MNKKLIYIIIFSLSFQFMNAQCYPDRHSTTWFDGWVSCETSINPNSVYGETHWIMYDFGYIYALTTSKLWNANEPNNLDYGIKDYTIDYSLDGNTWSYLGNFTLNQANGLSNFEGEDGPDFDNVSARYLLITPTSNYGGDCFGFSELKIELGDPTDTIDEEIGFNALVFPNPFDTDLNIKIVTLFQDKPITYALYDILGRVITENVIEDVSVINFIDLNKSNLSSGVYIFKIEQNNKQKTFKLIKK
ncbi:MAG: T9SS type A sorting domain-containing protein [Flavobacteriaceae bacterium]|nr:T9SS type A sorting domain-containing protein [Flavobacteriaceae bacterium]